jgi:hypothetical protein
MRDAIKCEDCGRDQHAEDSQAMMKRKAKQAIA